MSYPAVYLTNLTHINNQIPATESVPLNIGFLAAYAKKIFGDRIDVSLFNLHTELVDALKGKTPAVLGASNYAWNSNLSYHSLELCKKKDPGTITIMGGPTFPTNESDRTVFFKKRGELDFYFVGEGESAFADFITACFKYDFSVQKIKSAGLGNIVCFGHGRLNSFRILERIKDLNEIPSPYLEGFLDKFLERGFTPILQSNRGCPFSCAYCCSGAHYYNKVNFFSIERVKEEIEYIAKRTKSPSVHIHDDNFGMYDQDLEICKKFREVKEKYGWPIYISASTGKNAKDKIIECVKVLGNSIDVSLSLQSTNDDTLGCIKRQNIKIEDYLNIQKRLNEEGVSSTSELIVPLPCETLESHLKAIQLLMSVGTGRIDPYTTMLLPGSALYEEKRYADFDMDIKYRVIPRDFGKYQEKNIVEVEKVCVATKDFEFSDYVYARGLHLVIYCFYNGDAFRALMEYIKELGIDAYTFCIDIYCSIDRFPQNLKKLFNDFQEDTIRELWNSKAEIIDYYSQDLNFQKLVDHIDGCNLIQKYNGIFWSTCFDDFLRFSSDLIMEKCDFQYEDPALKAIFLYLKNSRGGLLKVYDINKVVSFDYDVYAWERNHYRDSITNYKQNIKVTFQQTERQKKIINDYLQIYGNSDDSRGKILTRINPKILFKEAFPVE
jgi:radical SAM superfamily enzyme YgiQ (UPF0313 family)